MADDLGDRMKSWYEMPETERRFLPMLPLYARVDGRNFSRFTKDMRRPYDERMTRAMIATTSYLVEETHAVIGYTQSDEISLLWHYPDYKSAMMFDRKVQKLVSVLAALTTAAFHRAICDHFPADESLQLIAEMPHFDARMLQFPSREEAANMLLWRNLDCTKNAVSMAAQTVFSHQSLQGVSSAAMQERLFQEVGINFNDYPAVFKRGAFVRRVTRERRLTDAERAGIPETKRPAPDAVFMRSEVEVLDDVPPLNKVVNRVEFIFDAEAPRVIVVAENPL